MTTGAEKRPMTLGCLVQPLIRKTANIAEFWPDITSPLARQVVATAYRQLPPGTDRGPAYDEPGSCPQEIHEYQLWLNARLRQSGLAKGLAGGLAFLPDPTDHLSWPWRYLARRYGPRNYGQLTRQIVQNLEWFVDQSQQLRDPWTIAGEQLPYSLLFTFMLFISMAPTTPIFRLHWLLVLAIFLGVWAFCYVLQVTWGRKSHRHKTNCAEFFHYLRREYSDTQPSGADHDYQPSIRSNTSISSPLRPLG
ncbi:hypothetical protein JW859_14305 [bacterium]|nr:hypothetical protein [bacterium]